MRGKNLDYDNTEMTKLEATFSKKSHYDQTKNVIYVDWNKQKFHKKNYRRNQILFYYL